MGIDPSSSKTGWCVGDGQRYLASGVITLNIARYKDRDAYGRLGILVFELWGLFSIWQPEVVGVEMPRPNRGNQHTNRVMGASLGVVLTVTAIFGCRLVTVEPQHVRATDYHKRAPHRVAAFIGEPVAVLKKQLDRCDAVGVWWYTAGLLREEWAESPESIERWRELVEG